MRRDSIELNMSFLLVAAPGPMADLSRPIAAKSVRGCPIWQHSFLKVYEIIVYRE
jgi:hypothetical protein